MIAIIHDQLIQNCESESKEFKEDLSQFYFLVLRLLQSSIYDFLFEKWTWIFEAIDFLLKTELSAIAFWEYFSVVSASRVEEYMVQSYETCLDHLKKSASPDVADKTLQIWADRLMDASIKFHQ